MALMLQGGDFIQAKLTDPTGRVAALSAQKQTDREVIEEFFLLTLSRRPNRAESVKMLGFLAAANNRKQRIEDMMYALLNHPEFLFQH